MIKRIKRFIPKTEYLKIYNALFLSHLTYCITSWGGIPKYRLSKVFALQKRCIRILFGSDLTYDHAEYYNTCARIRTFDDHIAIKSYTLEHTKPIFNDKEILSLENLYLYHSFTEVFKILKFQSPISLFQLFSLSNRDTRLMLLMPKVKLEKSRVNFLSSTSRVWNSIVDNIFLKCDPMNNGLMVPGSKENSDLAASMAFVKSKLKLILHGKQKSGDKIIWDT